MAIPMDGLRPHLVDFLRGGSAHVDAETVFADFPAELKGVRPAGAPHSPWELLEHLRLTLADLLRFCTDPAYKAPRWPEDYWPLEAAPVSADAWDTAAAAFHEQMRQFEELVEDPSTDLEARIPWGEGQTILREVLLAGDHTSYHLGQLMLLRKQLGAWKAD